VEARGLAVAIKVVTIVEIRAVVPKEDWLQPVSALKRKFLKKAEKPQVVAEVTVEVATGAVEANDHHLLKIKNVLLTQNVFYLILFLPGTPMELPICNKQLTVFPLPIFVGLKALNHKLSQYFQ
jgi:hypothetical protein